MGTSLRKILIVDDEPEFGAAVCRALESTGKYAASMATGGIEGLERARRHPPDLVLLDIRMPGMDGIAVLKKLKGQAETMAVPVLMLTALTDEQTKQQAAQFYNEDYIEKPVSFDVLLAKIEKTLAAHPQRRAA